jgi:hypothetical protein
MLDRLRWGRVEVATEPFGEPIGRWAKRLAIVTAAFEAVSIGRFPFGAHRNRKQFRSGFADLCGILEGLG